MNATQNNFRAIGGFVLGAVGLIALTFALIACAEGGPAIEEDRRVLEDRATTESESKDANTTDTKAAGEPTSMTKTTKDPAPSPIGALDTKDGAWVKLFDKLPGKDEKPATKLHTVTGKVDVYEVYDWAEHHEEMRGWKGHVWYRVDPELGHWVYGMENFAYTAKNEAQQAPAP